MMNCSHENQGEILRSSGSYGGIVGKRRESGPVLLLCNASTARLCLFRG